MWRRNLVLTIALVGLSFVVYACTHVNYLGRSFEPTTKVEVFFSKEEIEREYVIIGHAVGAGSAFISNKEIVDRLIEKAKSNGADAILITGVGRGSVGDDGSTETQIQASFLKFK